MQQQQVNRLSSNMQPHACQKGPNHNNQPIIMICLQSQCSRKRLCCLSCIDELHCKHQLISIKKFQNYLTNILNHNILIKNREEMLALIVKARNNIEESIELVRSKVNGKIDQIIKRLRNHFLVIEESFEQEKVRNVGEEIYAEFNDQKIEEYYKLAKKVQSNLVKSFQQITKSIQTTQKNVNDKLSAYLKQLEKHSEQITKSIQQFKITSNSSKIKIQFNQDTKSASLVLSNDNKTAKRGQGTGGYPIAVVNQPFSENMKSVSFTVQEQPGNKGIWMGVCVLDIVKNYNYQSCYGIGKGTWAIDQVGQTHVSAYTWSHHDTNYNSSPKVGWQFVIGDIITISVDFQKSIVKFTKNQTLFYEQPIKLDLGPIYAFAGPTHINDVISIV